MMCVDYLREAIDVDACRLYVLSRQVEQGGFCYYAYRPWGVEEPNAPDTYAAVAALRLMGQTVPGIAKCAAWLQAQQDADGGYPTLVIAHAAIKALRLLEAEPLHNPRPFLQKLAETLRLGDPTGLHVAGWLTSALQCVELWRDYDIAVSGRLRDEIAVALEQRWGKEGGFGRSETNLLDTSLAVALAAALELPVDSQTLEYARRCEIEPLGLSLTPTSGNSSLDVQFAGLRILRYFGAESRRPARIRQYVASCQTALGGFGRAPQAIAELSETWRAIEILEVLRDAGDGDGAEQRDRSRS